METFTKDFLNLLLGFGEDWKCQSTGIMNEVKSRFIGDTNKF